MVKINEKYSINTSGEGCSLEVIETKQRDEIVDKVKTGKKVEYLAREVYYYSTVEQCLNKILALEVENVEDIEGILLKIGEVKNLIKGLTNLRK
jgi:hypothetical protein